VSASFIVVRGLACLPKTITEANGWGREVISVVLAVQNRCWRIGAVLYLIKEGKWL
jgi:hypothetical protein